MCGHDAPLLLLTNVEGSHLSLCKGCASYGKVIKVLRSPIEVSKKQVQKKALPQLVETVIDGFNEHIKSAREKMGLKQEELAKKLNEKESLVHALETGHHVPNLELAKKLERHLSIRITETVAEEAVVPSVKKSDSYTLGDFIKIKEKD